jgi:hypothetical protein
LSAANHAIRPHAIKRENAGICHGASSKIQPTLHRYDSHGTTHDHPTRRLLLRAASPYD